MGIRYWGWGDGGTSNYPDNPALFWYHISLSRLSFSFATVALVSGRASVQLTSNIRFGRGTVVKPFAVIQSSGGRIIVGKFCSINNFVQIAAYRADVVLGDYVRIGPNVTILGGGGVTEPETLGSSSRDTRIVALGSVMTRSSVRV